VLYDPAKDGGRATTLSIVRRILGGGDWAFVSPFMISARERFGHDPAAARSWAAENEHGSIQREHLSAPSGLTRALPLFTSADPKVFRIVSRTWIAHNHWVLDDLANQLSHTDRRAAALASVERQIDSASSLTTTRGLTAAREILERLGA
jgi:hypothetical protein